MTTYAAARAWEESQVGTVETGGPDGHSGNIVPYWDDIGEHGDQGLSWCGAFQDDMAKHTGLKMPGSMISTHVGAQAFKDAGQWVPVSRGAKPGDFVFYAWSGSKRIGDIDHIGWVVEQMDRSTIQTIEGNTSAVGSSGASQRNGGMVAKRVRPVTFVVGYGRPVYDSAQLSPVLSGNPYNFHDHLVYASQWALGVKLTGVWDDVTKKALVSLKAHHGLKKALVSLKAHHGLKQDAGVGPQTIALLSAIKHTRKV